MSWFCSDSDDAIGLSHDCFISFSLKLSYRFNHSYLFLASQVTLYLTTVQIFSWVVYWIWFCCLNASCGIVFRYGSCAKANDFDMYAPNASFEDPLTHAQGYVMCSSNYITCSYSLLDLKFQWLFRVKQIKSAFYSLSKVYNTLTSFFTPMMMELLLNFTSYFSLQFFGESKIVEYHVQESDIAPGRKEVRIFLF